jgi:hypothetical protein
LSSASSTPPLTAGAGAAGPLAGTDGLDAGAGAKLEDPRKDAKALVEDDALDETLGAVVPDADDSGFAAAEAEKPNKEVGWAVEVVEMGSVGLKAKGVTVEADEPKPEKPPKRGVLDAA